MTNETSKQPQVMGTAAAGIRLGLYLVFSYVLWMYIPSIPFLSFLYLIALLFTPFVSYKLTKAFRDAYPKELPFPALLAWSYGTQTFFFAGIVLMLPCYYYFTQALPSQMPLLDRVTQEIIKQNPEVGTMFQQLYGGNPVDKLYQWLGSTSVWSYLWTSFSMTVFLGGIVSLINAFILRRNISK